MKRFLMILLVTLMAVGCATNNLDTRWAPNTGEPYAFWGGVWHGYTLGAQFIGYLIFDDATMVPTKTTGWYFFGMFIGLVLTRTSLRARKLQNGK